mmetsp:Transcript_49917/g.126956  ORF Transcript_49917/g.126956 Transcript_49917/m.126956 type:complete len:213 (-) Transcript_49917:109-747(-)
MTSSTTSWTIPWNSGLGLQATRARTLLCSRTGRAQRSILLCGARATSRRFRFCRSYSERAAGAPMAPGGSWMAQSSSRTCSTLSSGTRWPSSASHALSWGQCPQSRKSRPDGLALSSLVTRHCPPKSPWRLRLLLTRFNTSRKCLRNECGPRWILAGTPLILHDVPDASPMSASAPFFRTTSSGGRFGLDRCCRRAIVWTMGACVARKPEPG